MLRPGQRRMSRPHESSSKPYAHCSNFSCSIDGSKISREILWPVRVSEAISCQRNQHRYSEHKRANRRMYANDKPTRGTGSVQHHILFTVTLRMSIDRSNISCELLRRVRRAVSEDRILMMLGSSDASRPTTRSSMGPNQHHTWHTEYPLQ
jgi:hypothetical protein